MAYLILILQNCISTSTRICTQTTYPRRPQTTYPGCHKPLTLDTHNSLTLDAHKPLTLDATRFLHHVGPGTCFLVHCASRPGGTLPTEHLFSLYWNFLLFRRTTYLLRTVSSRARGKMGLRKGETPSHPLPSFVQVPIRVLSQITYPGHIRNREIKISVPSPSLRTNPPLSPA